MKINQIDKTNEFLNDHLRQKLFSGKKISKKLESDIKNHFKDLLNNFIPMFPKGVYNSNLFLKDKDAVLMLIDISGFTKMTERLAKLGREGAEEITSVINSYFKPIIKIILENNGDVVNFGGDSIEAIFPKLTNTDSTFYFRALDSALKIKKQSRAKRKIKTRHGTFNIGIHQVLESGKVSSIILGKSNLPKKYFIFSKVSFKLAKLENLVKSSQILLGSSLLKQVKKDIRFKKAGPGLNVLLGLDRKTHSNPKRLDTLIIPGEIEELSGILSQYSDFLLPGLLSKLKLKKKSSGLLGEHRRSTVVFLSAIFNSNISIILFKRYFEYLQTIVLTFGGVINKINFDTNGVKIIILFGAPYSHEDDTFRAVKFSKEIISAKPKTLSGFTQKIGINSGYVFAGIVGSELRQEYTVMGDVVNVAARIIKFASKDSVVVAEPIAKSISGNFIFGKGNEVQLKGKTTKIKIFQPGEEIRKALIAEWLSESKKLIGRTEELRLIKAISQTVSKGSEQVIVLQGEAGVGKSRLIREIIKVFINKKFKVSIGACHSYGQNISFLPWKEILKNIFGLTGLNNPENEKTQIKKQLLKIDPEFKNWLPLIYGLLDYSFKENTLIKSLNAKLKRERLFAIISRIFKYQTKSKPFLLILEDTHWMDNASIELLNYVISDCEKNKLFIILGARELLPGFTFNKNKNFKSIFLKEFSKEESIELIKGLVNIKEIPERIQNFIMTKSQGNPFYVEEVIKSFLESGLIFKKGKHWVIRKEIKKVDIPDSIQDIIMSRIDRLSEESRRLLQVASVIGREFTTGTLLNLFTAEQGIERILKDLKTLDLIIIREEKGVIYFFKHILTQEVAYGSLSFSLRRKNHLKLADLIETKHKRNLKKQFDILAHHYYYAQSWFKAFIYSMEAAEKAQNQFSNQEALKYYDQSMLILDKFSDPDYDKVMDLIKVQLEKIETKTKQQKRKSR
ncbi:AAA family ATPase [Candidatus Dependentiae bacterium]|nr:AAA family ATPase [Candidatus Dependentiae bacterium]